jgi:outer membrane protein assembly factor BamB
MRTQHSRLTAAAALGVVASLFLGVCGTVQAQPLGPQLGSSDFRPSPAQPVGWRGDWTGRFPGATPPTVWQRVRDGKDYTTKGIAWAAMLPNRGISSPIVVGDRVFVTAEFSDLICLDKRTGKILWIHSNMEFEALSPKDRQSMPAIAEKVEPLAAELARVNAAVVEELNARLETAATAQYSLPKVLEQKRKIEKQLRDEQFAINRKRFTEDWPQAVYGFCTETPASDGRNVCAFFATGVSVCYDLEGNRKWIARGSHGGEEKGHYVSPLLADNRFVVWGDPEIRAYDVATGALQWASPAEGSNATSIYRVRSGNEWVYGLQATCFYRASDGQPVWKPGHLTPTFATPIVEGDTIYFWTPGRKHQFDAYQVPASTEEGRVAVKLAFEPANWADDELTGKFDKGAVNASPLLVDGLIYHLYPGGGLLVHDAVTGKIVYRKVLPLRPRVEYWGWGGASASPTLAGKYIYLIDNQGGTLVIEPGRVYKEVAVNRIEERLADYDQIQPQNLASPFFDGRRLYFRTPGHLYCVGEQP